MSTRPRYVPHTTGSGKWDNTDINAVVDHVLAGETVTGFLAYPNSYLIRALAGGVYDAIDAVGTRAYGGPTDEGSVDGASPTAVFQAVAAAVTSGGLVGIGKGPYLLNDIINWLTDTTVVGAGIGNTYVKMADNVNIATLFKIGDNAPVSIPRSNVSISNLTLDGNTANNTDGKGIEIEDSSQIEVANVQLLNCQHTGIYGYNNTYLNIHDCYGSGMTDQQAFGFANNSYSRFHNLTAINCGSGGMVFDGSINSVFSNLYAAGNKTNIKFHYGVVDADLVSGCTMNNIIVQSVGDNAGYPALELAYLYKCNLSNIVLSEGSHGLDLNHSTFVNINNLYSLDAGATGIGVYFRSAANYCNLSNSSVDSPGTYDLAVDGNYNTVTGCLFKGAGNSVPVHVTGDYNRLQNIQWPGAGLFVQNTKTTNLWDGVAKSQSNLDLSGAAAKIPILEAQSGGAITGLHWIYTEASSADAGVDMLLVKYAAGSTFDTTTSHVGQAQWANQKKAITEKTFSAGDTIVFQSAGGKVGTGEVMAVVDYILGNNPI